MEKGQILGISSYLGFVATYMGLVSQGVLAPLDDYKLLDYTPAQLIALVLFAIGIGITIASVKNAGKKDVKDYISASSQYAQQFFGVDEKQLKRLADQVAKQVEAKVDPQGKVRGLVGKGKDLLGYVGVKVGRTVKGKLGIESKPKYPTPAEFLADIRGAYAVRQVAAAASTPAGATTEELYLRQVTILPTRAANVTSAEPEGSFLKRKAQYIYIIIIIAIIGVFLWWLLGR